MKGTIARGGKKFLPPIISSGRLQCQERTEWRGKHPEALTNNRTTWRSDSLALSMCDENISLMLCMMRPSGTLDNGARYLRVSTGQMKPMLHVDQHAKGRTAQWRR